MKKLLVLISVLLFVGTISGQTASEAKLFKKSVIRKTMKNALNWQLANPKHKLTDWTNGAFYAGVFAAYETTGSRKIWKEMYRMGEANAWKPGLRLHHADDHAICQTYIDMYRISGEEKMIAPFVETMDKFMATPYETAEIRPVTWWWCDALFMAPPAYVKLGITLKEDKYLELNDKLFVECHDLLYDKDYHLYARDIRYKWDHPGIEPMKEANGKKIFWSRGNGWVMGGLVRVLKELPESYPNREMYLQNFKEMASQIIRLQQADGLWRASLLDPESYPGGEASGSGFFIYSLAWGINNGVLDRETYLPAVIKGWVGLNSLIQPDGRVGWTQPIGADPKKNFNGESWEVYGTGAFLLAGSEVIKLKL